MYLDLANGHLARGGADAAAEVPGSNASGHEVPRGDFAELTEPILRIAGAAVAEGVIVDLVVSSAGPYEPGNGKSGLSAGGVGWVSVLAGTTVDLRFRFEDQASGATVALESFYFSVLDMDEEQGVVPELTIDGFDSYFMWDPSDVAVGADTGRTRFRALSNGTDCDDPFDPLSLGLVNCSGEVVDQRKRAVTFSFSMLSGLDLSFALMCRGECPKRGFNMFFSGIATPGADHCSLPIAPPPPPPPPPSTSPPELVPVVVQESPCVVCCVEPCEGPYPYMDNAFPPVVPAASSVDAAPGEVVAASTVPVTPSVVIPEAAIAPSTVIPNAPYVDQEAVVDQLLPAGQSF